MVTRLPDVLAAGSNVLDSLQVPHSWSKNDLSCLSSRGQDLKVFPDLKALG